MKLCWVFVLYSFWIFDFCYGGKMKSTSSIKYQTKQNNDITIKILVHMDQPLTKKLAAQLKSNTRKKLKAITNGILEDARKLFSHTSLNQTIKFKLIDTRFIRSRGVALNDNAPEYLQSYCDWQSTKKISRETQYYSVLFTGLDLFHVNNGRKVKSSSGRGYTRGICNARKSCAIIEWDPKLVGFLLAHEIGHSLGMRHDGPPYNQCNGKKNIMATKYDRHNHPKTWSPCSWYSLKQFLKTSKSLCVRSESNRITFKSNLKKFS